MSVLLVIVLVVLLLAGGDRIAAVGRSLGAGAKTFRKTLRQPAEPPARTVKVIAVEPKLLPAKGESSAENPPERDPEGS